MNIKCPICDKSIFKNEFEVCKYCGWEHDIIQENDIKYPGGANDLSLIEYKELYSLIIKKHPKYVWINDQSIFNKFTSNIEYPPYLCKCCGSYEIKNVGEKCPNCGWIDSQLQNTYIDVENVINKTSLDKQRTMRNKKESN